MKILLALILLLISANLAYGQAANFGFDFRATSGYVSDPSYAAPVLGESFPHTYTNGVSQTISAGWEPLLTNCSNNLQDRDRSTGLDARLAGFNFPGSGNSGTGFQCSFEVTLPSTGVWNIALAAGDATAAQSQYVQFKDNGTVFATYTAVATSSGSFMDATGTVYTAANWVGSNTILSHTFTSTKFEVTMGPNSMTGTLNSTLAYLNVNQLPQPPTLGQTSPVSVYGGKTASFACTANCTGLTWSCTGCSGSVNSSTGVYTAPSSVKAQQTLDGYQLLPNNHILNTRIDSLPTRSDSNTLIAGAGTVPVSYTYDFPFMYTTNSTPTDSMVFQYTPGNNGAFQIPTFPAARSELSWLSARNNDPGDHHLIRINGQNGQIQEQYQYYTIGLNSGCLTCNSQSGLKYQNTDYALPSISTDAAGLPLSPLTLRVQEVEQACTNSTPINHALRMTLGNANLHNAFLWPATTSANAGLGANFYGERLRLKSSFSISSFSACAQILLTQMKNYGLIIADGGFGFQISTEFDAWPASLTAVLDEINNAHILTSNWEVVDESGLQISAVSGEINTGRESVCATNSGSVSTCVEIATQGVGVNLAKNFLYIMAGTPAQQLTALVEDGGSNAVTWSMSPTVGTLTSGGLYTAPASASSSTSTTVTATSTVDSSISAHMTLWVFPSAGFYGLSATATPYTDSHGNVWSAGVGYGLATTPNELGCCQHDASFPNITDKQLYTDTIFSTPISNDINADFLVPQGRYLVTWHLGSRDIATGFRNFTLIGQGSILTSFDPTAAAGGLHLPLTYSTTLTVGSDNKLSFYIWGTGGTTYYGGDVASLSVVPAGPAIGSFIPSGNAYSSGNSIQ